MNEVEPDGSGTAARTLARLALLCLAGVVAAVVAAGQWLLLLLGLVGLALAGAGIWWAVAHRGVARLCGTLLAVAAPVAVLVLYAVSGLWPFAAAALGLWAAALACARSALRRLRTPRGMHSHPVRPPRRPVLIMNPRSGGGKVAEHGLVERAEALGARVILLDVDNNPDPAALARQAVAEGADLLGVAAVTAPRPWWRRWPPNTMCRSWSLPPGPATTSRWTWVWTATIRQAASRPSRTAWRSVSTWATWRVGPS